MFMLNTLTHCLIQVQNIPLLWEILPSMSSIVFPRALLTSTRFFATSWNQGQDIDLGAAEAMHRDYQSIFALLSQSLPHPFQESPSMVRNGLPLLFEKSYPLTINHSDLSRLNIFVSHRLAILLASSTGPRLQYLHSGCLCGG
jgi:hypothetical protein